MYAALWRKEKQPCVTRPAGYCALGNATITGARAREGSYSRGEQGEKNPDFTSSMEKTGRSCLTCELAVLESC